MCWESEPNGINNIVCVTHMTFQDIGPYSHMLGNKVSHALSFFKY